MHGRSRREGLKRPRLSISCPTYDLFQFDWCFSGNDASFFSCNCSSFLTDKRGENNPYSSGTESIFYVFDGLALLATKNKTNVPWKVINSGAFLTVKHFLFVFVGNGIADSKYNCVRGRSLVMA